MTKTLLKLFGWTALCAFLLFACWIVYHLSQPWR